jgi:hypothetical protein
VDPEACLKALTGKNIKNTAATSCPATFESNSSPVGIRMDCGDHINTVIDSQKPLFITPICNGADIDGFEASHFPLYLNTDCGIKANYLKQTETILNLPQLESTAESTGVLNKHTPFENLVDFGNSTLINDLLNLPSSSVNTIVLLVGCVIGFSLFVIFLTLYCCMGHAKFKLFLETRFPCCTDCCTNCDRPSCTCDSPDCKRPSCTCCDKQNDFDEPYVIKKTKNTPKPSRRGSTDSYQINERIENFVQSTAPNAIDIVEMVPLKTTNIDSSTLNH